MDAEPNLNVPRMPTCMCAPRGDRHVLDSLYVVDFIEQRWYLINSSFDKMGNEIPYSALNLYSNVLISNDKIIQNI